MSPPHIYTVRTFVPDLLLLLLHSKEVACSATTLKLNEGRTRTGKGHYLASGKRSDAIIRATDSQNALEYGAIEAKPFFAGETSTAFLDDYDKLTTTLGHMMARLVGSVGKPDDAAKLEVVGVVLAGLHYQSVRMWTRNGNVYVARPDALYCIPTNVRRLKDIVPLLFSVWQMMVSFFFFFFCSPGGRGGGGVLAYDIGRKRLGRV